MATDISGIRSLMRCKVIAAAMTALGQFRHFERPLGMSALPPIATKNGEPLKRRRRARSRRRAAARERQAPVEGPAPPLAWPVVHSAAEPPHTTRHSVNSITLTAALSRRRTGPLWPRAESPGNASPLLGSLRRSTAAGNGAL